MTKEKLVQVEMTEEAANCLAWFTHHEMCDGNISDTIIQLTSEWAARENKTLAELRIDTDEYQQYLDD